MNEITLINIGFGIILLVFAGIFTRLALEGRKLRRTRLQTDMVMEDISEQEGPSLQIRYSRYAIRGPANSLPQNEDDKINEDIIYNFIRDQIIHKGSAPTIREIMSETQLSQFNVRRTLRRLQQSGLLEFDQGILRGIELIKVNDKPDSSESQYLIDKQTSTPD